MSVGLRPNSEVASVGSAADKRPVAICRCGYYDVRGGYYEAEHQEQCDGSGEWPTLM